MMSITYAQINKAGALIQQAVTVRETLGEGGRVMRKHANDRKCVLLWAIGLNLMGSLSYQKWAVGGQKKRDDKPRKDVSHFTILLSHRERSAGRIPAVDQCTHDRCASDGLRSVRFDPRYRFSPCKRTHVRYASFRLAPRFNLRGRKSSPCSATCRAIADGSGREISTFSFCMASRGQLRARLWQAPRLADPPTLSVPGGGPRSWEKCAPGRGNRRSPPCTL